MGVLQFKRGNLADLPTLQEGEAYVVEDKDKVYMNINGNTRVFEAKPTALAVTAAQDFSERDLSFVDFDGSTALDECTFAGTNLTGAKNFPYSNKKIFVDALISANSLSTYQDLIDNQIISNSTIWIDGTLLSDTRAGEISFTFDLELFEIEIVNQVGIMNNTTIQVDGSSLRVNTPTITDETQFKHDIFNIQDGTTSGSKFTINRSWAAESVNYEILLPSASAGDYEGLINCHATIRYAY